MPTYSYACTVCDHRFDAVQSFSDDSLTVCPECEGRLRKVFNSVGVVFKGSGFYRNDSRTGAKNSSGGASSKGSSESSSSSTSTSTTSENSGSGSGSSKAGASSSSSTSPSGSSSSAKAASTS